MSAGMIVAARVPSAPPFLRPVSSFINCASLNASAPPVSEEKPMAPPEALDLHAPAERSSAEGEAVLPPAAPPPELTSLKAMAPPVSLVAPLKAIAPALFAEVRFVAPRFFPLFDCTGASSSL